MSLKLSEKTEDEKLNNILTEIEDNVATTSEVKQKQSIISSVLTVEPTEKMLSNGERVIYYDGSSYWEYMKIVGTVLKHQLTTV